MTLTSLHHDLWQFEFEKDRVEALLANPQFISPSQVKILRKSRKKLNRRIKATNKLIKLWESTH